MHLGLDLRGGSYLLLQIDFQAVEKQELNSLLDQARQTMRGAGLGYTGLRVNLAEHRVEIDLLNAGDAQAAQTALAKLVTYAPDTGQAALAVSVSGATAYLTIPQAALAARRSQAVEQSITIIQRRIDGSGVLNPQIARQGNDEIVVQLPGVSDPERIRTLIGTTAHMTFQLVDENRARAERAAWRRELPMQQPAADNGRVLYRRGGRCRSRQRPGLHRPADRPMGGEFLPELSRRPPVRGCHHRQCRPSVRHRARQQNHLGAGDPRTDHRRQRRDLRPFHHPVGADLALLLRAGALPAPIKII